jgi:hypothetical protein
MLFCVEMSFSRRTIIAAANMLQQGGNARLDTLALELGLEGTAALTGYSLQNRTNALSSFLLSNPDHQTPDGENLTTAVVGKAVGAVMNIVSGSSGEGFGEALTNSLERDGYVIVDSRLRRTLPEVCDLPAADDEVHVLLKQHNFQTSEGHLGQAIDAYARRNRASANAQLRAFMEGLLDEIAIALDPSAAALKNSEVRRQLLANRTPPFLSKTLNEWSDDGKNFINGLFKRLHAQGAHPGLSDEEDCTFRLHLVLLVARLLLRRI